MQWTDLLSNIERYTQQHKRSVSIDSIDLNAVFLQISRHKTWFLIRQNACVKVVILVCEWNTIK